MPPALSPIAAPSPLARHRQALAERSSTPLSIAAQCARRANSNASRNTYTHLGAEAMLRDAEGLLPGTPLYALPVSLKDLFDWAGTRTSAGTKFYLEANSPATADSAVAARLKAAGCLITGKTHMHPLAYGLMGENRDFGDCLQPRDSGLLTGGSSSGAAASVQEGSALVAIGTDTGGSVRLPAALCGLVGYRASVSLTSVWPQLWQGGVHLAASFDTIGMLLRDLRDLPELAEVLFQPPPATRPLRSPRIGCVAASFVEDANPDVQAAYAAWKQKLTENGATLVEFEPAGWSGASEIYSGIVAHEAAEVHRLFFDRMETTLDPAIAQRLRYGAALPHAEVQSLRARHRSFRALLANHLAQFDLLMLPSAPVNRLPAGADQTAARVAILRYTTPFSLAGLPVVTLPGECIGAPLGTGVQLAAPCLEDALLVQYAGSLTL